ncbi:hypothetical protein Ccrd_015594, partial [Cynara cardunculus var. scolymus]
KKFPKIEDTNQEIDFELFLESYQLVEPLIPERDDVYESLTCSFELYVYPRTNNFDRKDLSNDFSGSFYNNKKYIEL